MARWQYKKTTEPVPQTTFNETVAMDKWFMPTSQPVFKKVYVGVSTAARAAIITQEPQPLLDKWFSLTQQPLFSKQNISFTFPNYFYDPKSFLVVQVVTSDMWNNVAPPPIFRQPNLTYTYPNFFSDPTDFLTGEQVSMDKWFMLPSQPILRQRQLRIVGDARLTLYGPEEPHLGSWWEPTQIPQMHAPNWFYAYQFSTLVKDFPIETVTLDKFMYPIVQPVIVKQNFNFTYPAYFYDPATYLLIETMTMDKWFMATQQPVMVPKNFNQLYPLYFVDPTAMQAPPQKAIKRGRGLLTLGAGR